MKIWGNSIVQNEERYIWFSLMSAVRQLDKLLVWDTGSTDRTVEIIHEIKKLYPEKIEFKEVGEVDPYEYPKMRQKMLDETKSDWVMILDGDEVWWDGSLRRAVRVIERRGNKLDSIVTPYVNMLGDIYHYQAESAGRYEIDGNKGYLTIRFMNRNISGLHIAKPHGQQGFFDKDNVLIQERTHKRRIFLKTQYLHFTNLPRSSNRATDIKVPKRKMKLKYELGIPFPLDFYYPEVLFIKRPEIVPSPWVKMNGKFLVKSSLLTLPRRLKRKLVTGRSGY